MAAYIFELLRRGEAPLVCEKIDIPDGGAVWCRVEAFALRMRKGAGAFIRVLDEQGNLLVLAGVTTALASISACSCEDCPIKRAANRRDARTFLGAPPLPCRNRRACANAGAQEARPQLPPLVA
jgi:hypothetical protein